MVAAIPTILLFLFLFPELVFAKRYVHQLCKSEHYTCYVVQKKESWASLFPDRAQRDLVMRINRMNTKLYKGLTIAIPTTEQHYLDHAPLPREIKTAKDQVLLISIPDLAFGAYRDGQLQHWGPISSGKAFCQDVNRRCGTPSGTFKIYRKGSASCVSRKYPIGRGGAPMPYCMFFHGGYALHGSPTVPGYHDSHGCVRLFVNDARWLHKSFATIGTQVIVNR